jgi:peptide/nickel transport system permease protein
MIMLLLTLVFIILRIIPGDPALLHFEKGVDPVVLAEFRERLGLDKPLLDQYIDYLWGLLHLDFGISMQDYQPISTHLFGRFPATLELSIYSILFAVLLGLALGVKASKNYDTTTDHSIRLFSIVTYAIPVFFLWIVLQFVFSIWIVCHVPHLTNHNIGHYTVWHLHPPHKDQHARNPQDGFRHSSES